MDYLVKVFRKNLRDTYITSRGIPEDSEWPPSTNRIAVAVEIVHHNRKARGKELQENTCQGDAFHTAGVTKNIADIFTPDPTVKSNIPPRTILIEGAPGIGKTVLAKETAYKWAIGKILDKKNFFLLVYMRDDYIQSIMSLTDLLNMYANQDKEMVNLVNQHINRNGGEDVAFLLDGLDECPVDLKEIPLLYRLIRGIILPKAMVVATSRPTTSTSLFARKVEILGFAEEQQKEYIKSLDKKSKTKLLEYLDLHPIISSICHIPLCLSILAYLFEEGSLPKTLTEMNKLFIIHTVCHYMSKKGEKCFGDLTEITDFPEAVYAIIHKLSLLAYIGLQRNKLVFTSSDVKKVCPEIFEMSNGYGLLQGVKHYPLRKCAAGHTTSFNFLHLTIQEYLAAHFVSSLPREKQVKEIETFWKEHLTFMWMMFVGIAGIRCTAFQQFLSKQQELASGDTVMNRRKSLHLFQCILEGDSFDVTLPDVISGLFTDNHITLQGLTLLPYHVLSLTTFIAKSPPKWKSINLESCHMGDRGMLILRQFLCRKRYKAKTSMIEKINIFGNDLTSIHDSYCYIIQKGHFKKFNMTKHKLSDQFVTKVASAVSENSTIRTLDISSNKFVVDGIAAIVACLKTNITLESLDLSDNNIDRSGAELIADALCNNIVLKDLKMSRNDLHNDGAAVIFRGLMHNTKLKELDLSWNCISSKGACKIVESKLALFPSSNLEVLNLSHNGLGDSGAQALSDMLKEKSSLKLLDISSIGLSDVGADFVCDSLMHNSTLQHLNMSGNNITSADKIICLLEMNQCICFLDLRQFHHVDPFSFNLTIINALYQNNILTWLGLPKCTKFSQLNEIVTEVNEHRKKHRVSSIKVEYYN